jgi:hypothetical protein
MWTDDFKREKKGGRAKAQRRKEIKDWHVKTAYGRQRAKKKLFAAWRLCAQIISISKKKSSSLLLRPNYPPPQTGSEHKRK